MLLATAHRRNQAARTARNEQLRKERPINVVKELKRVCRSDEELE